MNEKVSVPFFVCIINPTSGGGAGEKLMLALKKLFLDGKFRGQVVAFDISSLEKTMREIKPNSAVLVGGGDGTISTVARHLGGSTIPLGILPIGTGNDLAKDLNVFKIYSKAGIEALLSLYSKLHTKALALWKLAYGENLDRALIFSNYVSFGFDAKVVQEFSAWRSRQTFPASVMLNRLMYAVYTAKNIFYGILEKVPLLDSKVTIELPNQSKSLIFTNIRSIAGLGVSNLVSDPFDERLELLAQRSIWDYFSMLGRRYVPSLYGKSPGNFIGSSSFWELGPFTVDPYIQADGEARPEIQANKFQISLSAKVQVLVP